MTNQNDWDFTFPGSATKKPYVTVIRPYIPEVPNERELKDLKTKDFNVLNISDRFHYGFTPTVNQAVSMATSEWCLLWNSDAVPEFDNAALENTLSELPRCVMCAAPAKIPGVADKRIVTKTETPGTNVVHSHVVITDSGSLWVGLNKTSNEATDMYYTVHGTSYAPLYAVRTAWFHWLGGLSTFYGPGYFEDAHFWRLTRRMGGDTAILPKLTYKHEGRGSHLQVYSKHAMADFTQENLRRYFLQWGHLEADPIAAEPPRGGDFHRAYCVESGTPWEYQTRWLTSASKKPCAVESIDCETHAELRARKRVGAAMDTNWGAQEESQEPLPPSVEGKIRTQFEQLQQSLREPTATGSRSDEKAPQE
jgi:hypothetical protein